MDPRIANLKSTTFFGKRLTRRQIAAVQATVLSFPALSRRELGHTICTHLGWYTSNGDLRIQLGLAFLEELEKLGIVALPTPRETMQRGPRPAIAWTARSANLPVIEADLDQLTPLSLQVVSDKAAFGEWDEMVDRHHYLGYTRPFGPHLRYWIRDRWERRLGCLLFAAAVARQPCRDAWIGWSPADRTRRLNLVVGNPRFLLLPGVHVQCLASKALSMATRRLADDWQAHHGDRPVLLETFVDTSRFEGTCYRAANWRHLGETRGGKGKAPKAIYVYPLCKRFQTILRHGPSAKPKPRAARSRRLAADDPFVHRWQGIIGTVVSVANAHDRVWQQRRRVLNTLLIMLFIFRLVLAPDRRGYAITLAELWDQCRTLQIDLPQPRPVAASAMSAARARVDEAVFKQLNAAILGQAEESERDRLWRGHRLFAVDGSKVNLPRQLVACGYRVPSDNAHYPQGLVSCLYRLRSRVPVDFDLVPHDNERKAARPHLDALCAGDVMVLDRGYYSWEMLDHLVARGLHAVFRIRKKAGSAFDAFIAGDQTDTLVEVSASPAIRKQSQIRSPQRTGWTHRLRLVKYTVAGTRYVLATTLHDPDRYPIKALSDVYHARWGIEELYKISKQMIHVEDFHAQTERGVKQELYAHFVLITMIRLFSNYSEDGINQHRSGKPALQANFKNSLVIMARNIESLLLKQANALSKTVSEIVAGIAACRQQLRPRRSYERRSRKPIGKWKPGKPAKATT